MHVFDYRQTPSALLSADITGLLLEIRECKGRQALWMTARPEVLRSLLDVHVWKASAHRTASKA